DDKRPGYSHDRRPNNRGHYYGRGKIHHDTRGRRVYRTEVRIVVRPPVRYVYRNESSTLEILLDSLLRNGTVRELGSTFLSSNTDYDVIDVRECGVNQVQLRVKRNDV